jgi:hypothetical protein
MPTTKWTVVECAPDEYGADAVIRAHGLYDTEQDALDALAEMRTGDPDTGWWWTTTAVDIDVEYVREDA